MVAAECTLVRRISTKKFHKTRCTRKPCSIINLKATLHQLMNMPEPVACKINPGGKLITCFSKNWICHQGTMNSISMKTDSPDDITPANSYHIRDQIASAISRIFESLLSK